MLLVFSEPDRLWAIQLHNVSVNPGADKAFTPDFFDYIPEFACLILDQRCQHYNFRFRFVVENLIDDLLRRLPGQPFTGVRIVRLTDCRKEYAQIIVNFGRSRDSRSGIRARTALFDGDRRGKPFDKIDIRLLHLIEKLPRVRGEAFHVAALAFGVERVKRERRFAGPAQSGNDDQFFPRNLQVEVLQVMLARSTDLDNLCWHSDVESRTF